MDSSCLVAIALGERDADAVARRLMRFEALHASNLVEAEYRGALAREEAAETGEVLDRVAWILPDRPLTAEFGKVLEAGYLRGADLWHVACALFLAGPAELTFLTLDQRQRTVAKRLGFAV